MRIDVGAIRRAADATMKLLAMSAATDGVGAEWFSQEHFEADNWPRSMAEHLALCDPATLLALVAVVEAAQRFVNFAHDTDDPSATAQLFAALAPFTPGAPGARDE